MLKMLLDNPIDRAGAYCGQSLCRPSEDYPSVNRHEVRNQFLLAVIEHRLSCASMREKVQMVVF